MAVSEQTPYIEYTANGTATSFALEFDCDNQDHLIVLVDDIEPVVGAWSLSNGAVVFNTAPENSKKITIQRNTPFSRNTNYQSYNNSFRPQSVNGDFDRVWLKLQELGVTDWLLRLYIDRLHGEQKTYIDQKDTQLQNNINNLSIHVDQQDAQLQQNINNLKTYVDDKDDELRAYLMEEIRKQGVALDQLDEYYNYLMQQLAQIAVDKGWDASFVVDASGQTQQQVNDNITFFNAVSVLSPAEKADIMLANPVLDLTTKAQLAIDTATTQGKICVFPYGTWNINMAKYSTVGIGSYRSGITINSNAIVSIMPKCTFKALASNLGNTWMIGIVGDNVTLNGGGSIIGDRKIHDYTNNGGASQATHENVFGVFTTGKNILIDNLIFREHTGDCILVSSDKRVREGVSSWPNAYHVSRNIKITNCVLDGARRNNISITDCEGFVISNNYIINAGIDDGVANGTNPKVGIDLEPYREANYAGNERVMNGIVSNNVFYNNALGGCVCHNSYNITITGNTSHGDAFKYDYSNNVSIIGNTFQYFNKGANSRSTAAIVGIAPPSVDWYTGFNNVTISGNTILDFPTGIDARGVGINVIGNTIKGATVQAVSAYNLKKAKLSANLIYDSFNGVEIKQLCEDITVSNNKLTNISNRGISTTELSGAFVIDGNYFKNCLTELYSAGPNNKIFFLGNTVDRTATTYSNTASMYVADSGVELVVANNTFIAINGNPINTAFGASLKATNNNIDVVTGAVFHNSTGKCVLDGNVMTVNNAATTNPPHAINIVGATGAIVSNNTVLGSPDGLRRFGTTIKTDASTASSIINNTMTTGAVKHSSDIERGTTIFGKLYSASVTYDPPSLAAAGTTGDSVTTTVTLTGAVVGDNINVAFSQYNAAIEISAQVSAANTVTVKFNNTSTTAVDLPSGTLAVRLI